jgi:2-keto-4-pentenoate hydratase/2-oxohepta-3-ene-1,7-dioic acid hydratase in catechol pathway
MSAVKFWEKGRKIVAVGRNFASHAKGINFFDTIGFVEFFYV